ncbi:hypothetical protein [Microbulbifer sp. ARAS458-1]|uniref:hypothetical protein n=1 Tax=Microbulbifer sp. ARAS458-1 TaxID=3140242 RepID=UPI0038781444
MRYREFVHVREQFERNAEALTQGWRETGKSVNAMFPQGYIRKFSELRPRWPYLDSGHKTLVCQISQVCDVNAWNLHVWNLLGTAGAAYVWHCTLPLIAIIEVLCREFCRAAEIPISGRRNFEGFINGLHESAVIDSGLAEELHDLRMYRNIIHLNADKTPEINTEGYPAEWVNANVALQRLEVVLKEAFPEVEQGKAVSK